jgi:hypothetical protein
VSPALCLSKLADRACRGGASRVRFLRDLIACRREFLVDHARRCVRNSLSQCYSSLLDSAWQGCKTLYDNGNGFVEREPVQFDQKERRIVLADFYTHPPKDFPAHLGPIHISSSCLKPDRFQLLE